MREIERALPVRRLDDARHRQQIGAKHEETFERHITAVARQEFRGAAEIRLRASKRRLPGSLGRPCSRRVRPPAPLWGATAAPPQAVSCRSSSAISPSPRSRCPSSAATSRICPRAAAMSVTIRPRPDGSRVRQHGLHDRPVPRADQDEVGIERQLPRHPNRAAESVRLLGHTERPGCPHRGQSGDLFRIGQREHQLIGTEHRTRRCVAAHRRLAAGRDLPTHCQQRRWRSRKRNGVALRGS